MSRLPFELAIPEPCAQQWQDMSGIHAARHCASCDKTVHNLAALTPSQIERLVHENEGHLCARITRRHDGSLVMQDRSPSKAAAAALFTLVSIPVMATAQSERPKLAIISGKIDSPTPSAKAGRWSILMEQDGQTRAMVQTDERGTWRTELPPGIYDLVVIGIIEPGRARVSNVTLHPGEQSFGTITPVEEIESVTVGGVIAIPTNPFQMVAYYTRHPIRLVKTLSYRFRHLHS